MFLILLLCSTQLGLHFWPSSSLVYGIRVDYLSPTLYFLDILILCYLTIIPKAALYKFRFAEVSLFLLTNLVFSTNQIATLAWSLHLSIYIIFIQSLPLKQASIYKLPILATATFQLILSVVQLILGHSLQGPLYYLGERMVSVGQPGVALATFMDQVVLRGYGTFSHPNILAGYLVISLLIIRKVSKNTLTTNWMLVVATLGVIVAQSRSAALTLFGIIIPFYFITARSLRLAYFVFLLTLVIGCSSILLPPRADLSISERLSLQTLSLNLIKNYPILGTGASASISTYPTLAPSHRLLQPDHNSLTLFLSWFGAVGILASLYLVGPQFSSNTTHFLPLLPLLLLDHYLLTSPQGLLILLIYFKVVNYSHVKSRRQ